MKDSKTAKKFVGTFTALVTPFSDGKIDYPALENLIKDQLSAGIDGLVVLGTTGESPVIDDKEREDLVSFALKKAGGKTKIIVGTGGNDTQKSVKQSQRAEKAGADAVLIVNPYYNKPTQEGLYRHFSLVAESIGIPVIVYNIKGRTGVNLETKTLLRLTKHGNIAAVKEASGDIGQIMDVIRSVPKTISVLSGDDPLTYPIMALGGVGVISVLSNLIPREVKKMVDLALARDFENALKCHYELLDLMKMIFIETNPIPIKTALALRGKIREEFRLPLCEMEKENRDKWKKILDDKVL